MMMKPDEQDRQEKMRPCLPCCPGEFLYRLFGSGNPETHPTFLGYYRLDNQPVLTENIL
jgi:hypothetical protein